MIVILIALRVLVPWWVYADLKAEKRAQGEEIKALRETRDQAVAALNDTKNVMAALQYGLQAGLHGGEGVPPPPEASPGGPSP